MTGARAAIGLGGNVGDSAAVLTAAAAAVEALPRTRAWSRSALYATPAWGVTAQADFLNAVVVVDTTLGARELLDALLAIEREAGRERRDDTPRWGPRVLDLDLLLYGDAIAQAPGLQVPHPRLHQRAFALVPLVDAWPDAVIPGVAPARDCLAAIGDEAIRALPYAPWRTVRPS